MSDIEAWAAIEGDPEVRKFVDNKTLTFKEAKAYVLENIEGYRINGYGRYAVREKSNNNLVGMCGLDLSRFDAAPLIAFTVTKETDYGTETDGRIPPRCSTHRVNQWVDAETGG